MKILKLLAVGGFALLLTACSQGEPSSHSASSSSSSNSISTSSSIKNTIATDTISDSDIVGVWVNHIDTDIHQQITFKDDHTWTENQRGITDIYSGTWSISDDDEIYLEPYGETIKINPNNIKEMDVIAHNHTLTKE